MIEGIVLNARRASSSMSRIVLFAVALLAASSERSANAQTPAVSLTEIDEFRELLIVHPTVVDPYLNGGRSHNGGPSIPGGAWSFRGLMQDIIRQANGGAQPSAVFQDVFLSQLFESWLTAQELGNGQVVPPRDADKLRTLVLDQFSSVDPTTGLRSFDLWKAPFELIAIANRADLAPADSSDAGELRFVYKLVHPDQGDQKFTFIIEYKVPVQEWNRNTWAHLWHQLSTFEIGSDAYLRKLDRLTNHVTRWSKSESAFPRRVAHIRTNEIALAPAGERFWEMREFRPGTGGLFELVQPFNQPDAALNAAEALERFAACTPALSETDGSAADVVIPNSFTDCNDPGYQVSMLSPRAVVGEQWVIPGEHAITNDNFGMLTCNGCHNDHGAPKAFDFYHVAPEFPPTASVEGLLNGTARLSLFLTDDRPLADDSGVTPSELHRRKLIQLEQLETPCTLDVCVPGTRCVADSQCYPALGLLCVEGRCSKPAHCSNWAVDIAEGESDQDCGGPCTYCYYGRSCLAASDCYPGASCVEGVCVQ